MDIILTPHKVSGMLKVICASLLLLAACKTQKQNISPEAAYYLDTILDITQRTSLFREKVDWVQLRNNIKKQAGNAQKTEDIFPAVQYMFDQLKDEHGGLLYMGKRTGAHTRNISDFREVLLSQVMGKTVQIKTAVMQDTFGYILIPSMLAMTQEETNRYAQMLQDSVCKLNPEKLSGWIIDLRLNVGGNMYPMIAGIANLLGDGVIGFFERADGVTTIQWSLKNGELFFDDKQLTDVKRKCLIRNPPKIAVLISEITSSSGESTAIALKGRANTKFFGEKTYGYVTANAHHQLNENLMLLVAETYVADRNKYIYKNAVPPDTVMVEGDNFYDLGKDLKIIAALKWLKGK